MGGLVTPDTLVADTAMGQVVTRQIADKPVMTVQAEGGTAEVPVPESRRRAPVLDDRTVYSPGRPQEFRTSRYFPSCLPEIPRIPLREGRGLMPEATTVPTAPGRMSVLRPESLATQRIFTLMRERALSSGLCR